AGADHVDRVGRGLDLEHFRPHRRDGAGDLVDGLAADAQRHQEAADLRRRRVARHDDAERLLGLGPRQRLSRRSLGDERLEVGLRLLAHAGTRSRRLRAFQAAAISRKLPRMRWPCSEAMLSGWNWTPWTGCRRCMTPMITSSSAVAVTSRSAGSVSGAMVSEW